MDTLSPHHIDHKIAVIIPCYKVRAHIEAVIKAIPEQVSAIYCVDDACPDQSRNFILENINDERVIVMSNPTNQGVGGAMVAGYERALADGATILVKIDGDGQMNPALIPHFVAPIINGECDYTKGNRFYNIDHVRAMPRWRIFGNAVLSFLTKLSSGYWPLFDPTNGYTAIHHKLLKNIPMEKLDKRYFFESDMLFRLNLLRAHVIDIPMEAVYGEEESNLKISKIIFPFLKSHFRNIFKRIIYNYFLRDFNIASLQILLGVPLLIFGVVFGVSQWVESAATQSEASAGTVMLSALPIIIGLQLILSFFNYDIENTPKTPIHPKLSS